MTKNYIDRIRDQYNSFLDSDLLYSFTRSPLNITAGAVTVIMIAMSLSAPLVSPHNPYDLADIDLMDSLIPPVWMEDGESRFLLGSDNLGRDVLSTIFYGSRISIIVGFLSVTLSMLIGITLGLISGYVGGRTDAVIMRIAEIQQSFPAILLALLINGVMRILLPGSQTTLFSVFILVIAIGTSGWVQYARTVRGSTMVEARKEYVQAAQIIGVTPISIMRKHVLPNVMGPVLVIATIHLSVAVITEATLSFLGVGVPSTEPSLGTLIRIGNDFLFSGEWWISFFPGLTLATLALAINFLGDWLRDALNPKLK